MPGRPRYPHAVSWSYVRTGTAAGQAAEQPHQPPAGQAQTARGGARSWLAQGGGRCRRSGGWQEGCPRDRLCGRGRSAGASLHARAQPPNAGQRRALRRAQAGFSRQPSLTTTRVGTDSASVGRRCGRQRGGDRAAREPVGFRRPACPCFKSARAPPRGRHGSVSAPIAPDGTSEVGLTTADYIDHHVRWTTLRLHAIEHGF